MTPSRLTEAPRGRACAGLAVLHEDARILVVDKPPGLLSQPGVRVHDSVSARVIEARPDAARVALVHRLDMDTSGVLVLAKDADAHRHLSAQFERRTVAKRYRALLERRPPAAGGTVRLALRSDLDDRPRQIVDPVRGRASVTHWFAREPGVAGAEAGSTEVVLLPLTGRSHQLRVHAADPRGLGIAIRGDRLYGAGRGEDEDEDDGRNRGGAGGRGGEAGRLCLHAERLAFFHPDDGRRCEVRAPLPFGVDAGG